MALFNFTDISFSTQASRAGVSTDNLLDSGRQQKYGYNVYRYPENIGSADIGHYMVIHINTQRATQFKIGTTPEQPTVISSGMAGGGTGATTGTAIGTVVGLAESVISKGSELLNTVASSTVSKIIPDGVASAISSAADIGSSVVDKAIKAGTDARFQAAPLRTIQRSTDTIALYMPDTVVFTDQQSYATPSLGDSTALKVMGAAKSIVDSYTPGSSIGDMIAKSAKNLTPFALNYLARNSEVGKTIVAGVLGVVTNPLMEIIYSSPSFRSFRFDFMFYPRSETEAKQVYNIIQKLRFHQAPEIAAAGGGFFLVPPSEFDIEFYYNGRKNPNIPPISTCVLETLDVNYAPNGFSAYEVPGQINPTVGGTGTPVAIQLSLQFRETEIMTKKNFQLSEQAADQISDSNIAQQIIDQQGGAVL